VIHAFSFAFKTGCDMEQLEREELKRKNADSKK
jgi:hypothetical protein